MTDKDLFKIWNIKDGLWNNWIRPLSFLNATKESKANLQLIKLNKNFFDQNSAIFVDLDGDDSIVAGIALAKLNFQPVPLFNGTDPQKNASALVNTQKIKSALLWASDHLKNIEIKKDAPPAFLLDNNRILRYKSQESIYDNSWDLYDQDIPSIDTFKKANINKIIIYSYEVLRDLKAIFYKFQQKGIKIYFTDGLEKPKRIILNKPSKKDKYH